MSGNQNKPASLNNKPLVPGVLFQDKVADFTKVPPQKGITNLTKDNTKLSIPCYATSLKTPNLAGLKFVYNYFTQDERISGVKQDLVKKVVQKDDYQNRLPRYNRIDFESKWDGAIFSAQEIQQKVLLNNLDKIIFDDANSNFLFTSLQDLNIINQIRVKTSGSLQQLLLKYVQQQSSSPMEIFTSFAIKNSFFDFGNSQQPVQSNKPKSNLDTSLPLNLDMLSSIDSEQKNIETGISYTNDKGKSVIPINSFDDLSNQAFYTRINKNHFSTLVENANFNVHSQFSGTLQSAQDVTGNDSNYYYGVPYLEMGEQKFSELQLSSMFENVKLAGFLINRYFVDEDGNVNFINTITIDDPNQKFYLDTDIKYGVNYAYSIRSVFSVPLFVFTILFKPVLNYYLIPSKTSAIKFINCVENVPPPPPTDFDFYYDYNVNALRLTWNMPLNSQRDIKGYMVLRRKSVDEPYQMLKFFDFNDAKFRYPLPDYLMDPEFLQVSQKPDKGTALPILTMIDPDFKKTDKYIYAIISHDAHNLESNLSAQFEVSFNSIKNKLQKKLISKRGAPIHYPNLFIEQDLFKDTIFLENYSRLRLSFDPSCVDFVISNKDINDPNKKKNLYETYDPIQNSGKYIMTFLNVDNLKFQTLEVRPIEIKPLLFQGKIL